MSDMIATKKVFDQAGVLRNVGETVVFDEKAAKTAKAKREKRDRGFAKGNAIHQETVEVAAIAPSGPNPTAPQQLPPGSAQTLSGYVGPEGEKLVGETAKSRGK